MCACQSGNFKVITREETRMIRGTRCSAFSCNSAVVAFAIAVHRRNDLRSFNPVEVWHDHVAYQGINNPEVCHGYATVPS